MRFTKSKDKKIIMRVTNNKTCVSHITKISRNMNDMEKIKKFLGLFLKWTSDMEDTKLVS